MKKLLIIALATVAVVSLITIICFTWDKWEFPTLALPTMTPVTLLITLCGALAIMRFLGIKPNLRCPAGLSWVITFVVYCLVCYITTPIVLDTIGHSWWDRVIVLIWGGAWLYAFVHSPKGTIGDDSIGRVEIGNIMLKNLTFGVISVDVGEGNFKLPLLFNIVELKKLKEVKFSKAISTRSANVPAKITGIGWFTVIGSSRLASAVAEEVEEHLKAIIEAAVDTVVSQLSIPSISGAPVGDSVAKQLNDAVREAFAEDEEVDFLESVGLRFRRFTLIDKEVDEETLDANRIKLFTRMFIEQGVPPKDAAEMAMVAATGGIANMEINRGKQGTGRGFGGGRGGRGGAGRDPNFAEDTDDDE